jgi:hypothetical protein
MLIFKTETGSIYHIDTDTKTWKRVLETEESGKIRTIEGPFDSITPIEIGASVTIFAPPLNLHYSGRMITTSPVVEVTEH